MSVKVFVTTELSKQLRAIDEGYEEELIAQFKDWQSLANEYDSYWFVRKKAENNLVHTHMVPCETSESRAEWDRRWQNDALYANRTSDKYLLYAHNPHFGYLLIAIYGSEPNGHELWTLKKRATLRRLQEIATDFVTLRKIP